MIKNILGDVLFPNNLVADDDDDGTCKCGCWCPNIDAFSTPAKDAYNTGVKKAE